MPPVLTKNGDSLELALAGCRGSEFQDAKEKIKEVPGRRFDFDRKVWVVPADPASADRILKTIRPEADDDLMNWIKASMRSHEASLTSPLPTDAKLLVPWATKRCAWQPETVNDEPFTGATDYQRAAIDKMAREGRAINADDMGLGKTFEAITAVEEWILRNTNADGTAPEGPKLVIAPASTLGGFERELHRWLKDPEVVIIAGTPKKRKELLERGIEDNAWILVNYEQLRVEKKKVKTRNGGTKTVVQMKEPLFETTEWLAVIGDEIHKIKNPKASQSQGVHRIQAPVMFGLTGTPVMNSPDELWSILRWLWPDQYHESGTRRNPPTVAYWAFYEDFVDYYEDHFKRKTVTGVKNPDALRFVLKDKLIRRTSAILGLKGRKRFFYPVSLNPGQQKLYDEAERAMWLAVEKDMAAGNADALAFARAAVAGGGVANLIRIPNGAARLVHLQKILENAALMGGADDSGIMDDFEEKYIDSRPNQWVMFFKFRHSCDLMAERLSHKHGAKVGVYTGDTKAAGRTELEDKFRRGELDVLVGTIAAMYQGINLQNSWLQAWGTRDFVPAINDQGESRQDRKGQSELVRVYIPQPPDTVATDKVAPINRLKQTIEKTVLPKDTIEEDHS